MKLTFLGTSAGESYPALWCHCPNCTYAREWGGRNIRQNSCAFVDDDLMLDLSSHAFHSALRFGVDISAMRYLFVTHDHRDHFDSQHLTWRSLPVEDGELRQVGDPFDKVAALRRMGARQTPVPFLEVYGHESVFATLLQNPRFRPKALEEVYAMRFTPLHRGQVVEKDGLRVTAVVSHHSRPGSVFNYIIERNGKTLLYALDCGGYDADMLEVICSHRYDCVVLEGTFGKMETEYDMHQNFRKNLRAQQFLREHGLWKGEENFYLSHMSPHWTPPHDLYVREMQAYGIHVAYDGLQIDF